MQQCSACGKIYRRMAERQIEFRVKGRACPRARRDHQVRSELSALTSLIAWRRLVDDVDAALAANHAVVAMTALQGLERILDLHWSCPSEWALVRAELKGAPEDAPEITTGS